MGGLCSCLEDSSTDVEKSDSGFLITQATDTYHGERNIKHERHGKGVYFYPNGDVYDGDWHKNMKHGYGQYVFQSGKTLVGYFEKDNYIGDKPADKSKKKDQARPLIVDSQGSLVSIHQKKHKNPLKSISKKVKKVVKDKKPSKDEKESLVQEEAHSQVAYQSFSRTDALLSEEEQRLKEEENQRFIEKREKHQQLIENMRKKYNLPPKSVST